MDYSNRENELSKITAYGRAQVNFQYFIAGERVFAIPLEATDEQKQEKENYKKVLNEIINDVSFIKSLLEK